MSSITLTSYGGRILTIVDNAKAECLSVLTIALSDLDLFIDT